MEIRDYLRAIRRILPLLIILPIVAAAITGFFLEKQPSKYQANATVVVPAISGNGTSQSAASQYVDTFKDVLVSEPVVADVHQKFNIPTAELVAGLSADTVTASSNIIHVVLVGLHDQNLTGAVREATVETMDAIAQPSLIQAQNEVTEAQTLLQKANAAINDFVAEYGNPSPAAFYNVQSTRLLNLESELVTATINNNAKLIPGLQSSIATQKQAVTQAGQQLAIYTPLQNAQSAASAANDHASSQLVAAQALVATDQNPSTVTVVNIGRLSKLSDVIKFAAIAFALALLMMLGLILILELMRSGRRPVKAAGPEQGSFAWPAAPPASSQAAPSATSVPATPAPATSTEVADATLDPWRATTPSTAHVDATESEISPERSGGGLLRR
jgi:capsular polysaccharide biosynthesis protein